MNWKATTLALSLGFGLLPASQSQDGLDGIVTPLTRGLSVEINQGASTQGAQNPASDSSKDGNITLTINKRIFQKGDLLSVTVRAKHDCFLRLFHKGVDGSITQIFPNRAQNNNQIRAGIPVTIPAPNAGFSFRVHEPYGDEVILAVATFKQIGYDQYKPQETFKTYKSVTEVKQYIHRGLSVVAKKPAPSAPVTPTTNYRPPAPKPPQYKPTTPGYQPQYKEHVSHVAVAFRIQAYY